MAQQAVTRPAPPAPWCQPNPAASRPAAAPPARPNGRPVVAPPPSVAMMASTAASEPKPSPPTHHQIRAGAAANRSALTPQCSTLATPTIGKVGWASNTQPAPAAIDSPWGRGEDRRRERGYIGRPRAIDLAFCTSTVASLEVIACRSLSHRALRRVGAIRVLVRCSCLLRVGRVIRRGGRCRVGRRARSGSVGRSCGIRRRRWRGSGLVGRMRWPGIAGCW